MSPDHELDSPPWLRVESTIMAAARQIRCLYDQRLSELDLNLSQASLLAYVEEFGPNSQTVLAERMGLGRASTGAMIDQLEPRGLIERMPDPDDRRVWLISITDDGRELVTRISKIDGVVREGLRDGITRRERQQLASLLVRIQRNLSRGLEATDDLTPSIPTTEKNS
ncbi:MAG: MarR family winged helix-turn-helix transcriptional regulator [Acidimicrobiales bacterium]